MNGKSELSVARFGLTYVTCKVAGFASGVALPETAKVGPHNVRKS